MPIHRRALRIDARFAVFAALLSTPALAFEPTGSPIADAVLTSMAATGGSPTYGSATGDATSASLADVAVTMRDGSAIRIAEIVVEAASTDGRRLTMGRIDQHGVVVAAGAFGSLTIEKMTGEDVVVPDVHQPLEVGAYQLDGITARLHAPEIVLPLGTITHVQRFAGSETVLDSDTQWNGLTIPRDILPPESSAVLLALGYDRIALSASSHATQDLASGDLSGEVAIDADNIGRVVCTIEMSGVTLDRIVELQKELAAVEYQAPPTPATPPDAGAPPEAPTTLQVPQLLPEELEIVKNFASGIVIHRARYTFENRSVVERLLAMNAAQAGIPADVYAKQLAAAMPAMLLSVKDPVLREQVAAAASAFLLSPGSITLELDPPRPLSFGELLANPPPAREVPALLGIRVTAAPAQ